MGGKPGHEGCVGVFMTLGASVPGLHLKLAAFAGPTWLATSGA